MTLSTQAETAGDRADAEARAAEAKAAADVLGVEQTEATRATRKEAEAAAQSEKAEEEADEAAKQAAAQKAAAGVASTEAAESAADSAGEDVVGGVKDKETLAKSAAAAAERCVSVCTFNIVNHFSVMTALPVKMTLCIIRKKM